MSQFYESEMLGVLNHVDDTLSRMEALLQQIVDHQANAPTPASSSEPPTDPGQLMHWFLTGPHITPGPIQRIDEASSLGQQALDQALTMYKQGETASAPGHQEHFTHTLDTAQRPPHEPIMMDPGPALSPLALPRNAQKEPWERFKSQAEFEAARPGRTFDQEWEKWRPGDLIVWEEDKQGPMFRIVRIDLVNGYVWWDNPKGGPENMTRCENLLRVALHDPASAPAPEKEEEVWFSFGGGIKMNERSHKALLQACEYLERNKKLIDGHNLAVASGWQVNEWVAGEWLKHQQKAEQEQKPTQTVADDPGILPIITPGPLGEQKPEEKEKEGQAE